MTLRILHIDDDKQLLKDVASVVKGHEIGAHVLEITHSNDFENGLKALESQQFDLVILDLCVGKANKDSDKIGQKVFDEIKNRAFIPVVFFTGLPEYVKDLRSDIVGIAAKGTGYDDLYKEIEKILKTGYIELKNDIELIVKDGLRSYFWNFVHPNASLIEKMKKEKSSLKYILLRRLAKSLSFDTIRSSIDDPKVNKLLAHPNEFYIFPPMEGEYETGDILKSHKDGEFYIILTPACDLVLRKDGTRKADKILIAQAFDFSKNAAVQKYQDTKKKLFDVEEKLKNKKDQGLEKELGELNNQAKNQSGAIKALMKPGNDRFFFLPGTPFLPAMLLDYQHKSTITYKELEKDFEIIATLDDPFSQSMLSSFTRYYNRIGFPDLDVEYSFLSV